MPLCSPAFRRRRTGSSLIAVFASWRPITVVLIGSIASLASACKGDTATPKNLTSPPAAGADTNDAGPKDAATAPASLGSELVFTAAQIQHGGVRWGPVTVGTDASRALVPGEVVPDENRTARLGAPASGRVVVVRVQPGDRVASGQVLVTMQSPEAGTAQSDVEKATAQVTAAVARGEYADAARARAERLLALKAIPQQDYDQAIADDEQAHASLTEARSELTRAKTAAGQLGASDLSLPGESVIRSAMSGVVLARTAVAGTVVDAGAPLVVVTEPSRLWLSINAPEQFAPLFHSGDGVRFTVPAFPADTFRARIDAVGAGLDPDTRTLAVRATIANADNRLKPEMLASVLVEGGASVPAAWVPQDAVQLLDGKPNVFVAQPDDKGGVRVERREVELGSRAGGRVAVIRGLAAGDVIVTAGAFAVKAEFKKATLPKEAD